LKSGIFSLYQAVQKDVVMDEPPNSAPTDNVKESDDAGDHDQDIQEDEHEDMPDDEFYDEDPTWSPEEIDAAYKKLNDDDDSAKNHDNPR